MFYDLYIPFPLTAPNSGSGGSSKKNQKQKNALQAASNRGSPSPMVADDKNTTCWNSLATDDRDDVSKSIGMAGHLGCEVVACSVTPFSSGQIPPNPFSASRPFPELDPRTENGTAGGPRMIQLSRLNVVIDDSANHGITTANGSLLNSYDIIAALPTTAMAFQKACLELSQPGVNQVTIISLPLHQGPKMPFYLKRSLVKTALRNGAVFEIPYAAALIGHPTDSSASRRTRQNFLTNARELVRVVMAVSPAGGRDGRGKRGKGGGGIIFSSGPGPGTGELRDTADGGDLRRRGWMGMRGPADLINLAATLGLPANQAKDAIASTPKAVILRAQSRKTYKGVLAQPRMVMPENIEQDKATPTAVKRQADQDSAPSSNAKRLKPVAM